jgi:hypothetical protein
MAWTPLEHFQCSKGWMPSIFFSGFYGSQRVSKRSLRPNSAENLLRAFEQVIPLLGLQFSHLHVGLLTPPSLGNAHSLS